MAINSSRGGAIQVDTDLVRQLAELLDNTQLTEIEVQDGERRIKVARQGAAAPAAITTIMVSPIARLIASITPATMPGSAAGTNTLRMVSDVVAPMARLPSRMAWGTAAMESSAMEETKGMIITPITRPAASALSLDALEIPSATAASRTIGATVRAAK